MHRIMSLLSANIFSVLFGAEQEKGGATYSDYNKNYNCNEQDSWQLEGGRYDGDSDDYREPQQRNPVGNNSKKFHDKYDDDEFDGFE